MGQFDDVAEECGSGRQSGDADRGRGRRADSRQAVRRQFLACVLGARVPSQPIPRQASLPTNPPAGSILGGLGDLIGKLTAGGVGPQVNSWVGHGPNEPSSRPARRRARRATCSPNFRSAPA